MTTSYPFVQIYFMYILKSIHIHIQCTIYNRHIHISYKHINTYIYIYIFIHVIHLIQKYTPLHLYRYT